MATARFETVTKTIEKVVLETIEEKKVTLSLDEEEAVFLLDILGRVAGEPEGTRRRHCDAIFAAIRAAGVESTYKQTGFVSADIAGYITIDAEKK